MLLILLLTLPLQLPNLYLQHAGWFSWDGIQIHHPLSGTGLLHPAYLLWTITYKNRGAFEKKFFELWFTWMDGGVRDSGYSCSNLARDQDVCIGDLQARLTLMRCDFDPIALQIFFANSLRVCCEFTAILLEWVVILGGYCDFCLTNRTQTSCSLPGVCGVCGECGGGAGGDEFAHMWTINAIQERFTLMSMETKFATQ